jgi:tetratricopeptide (TPR) repeat protein
VLALALVLAGSATAGALLWAQHHLRAARRALDRYAFAEAQHHLDLYLTVHFRSAEAHLLAAQAARRRDAYDDAERHLAACLQMEEMTDAAALERLLLTAQRGDLDGVEERLRARTGADDPEAVLVFEALAKGFMNCFLWSHALVCLNILLERQPEHPQALFMRARVWEQRVLRGETEREQDALRDYEKAVELDPTPEARLGLAGALYRVGRPAEAAALYEQLRSERPDDAELLLGLARCRFGLHEADEARRLLDGLLERHPGHAAALLERGRLALHAGELAEAEKWLRQAASAAPHYDGEARRVLCRCLEAAQKTEDARRCLDDLRQQEADVVAMERLILQANRDPNDVALRYEIAVGLRRIGREQDAMGALLLVVEQDPRHGPAHQALADYFERAGQPGRAARHRGAAGSSRAAAGTPAR